MRIAFYAPMRAPDDPTPSGEAEMARQLVDALRAAGSDVRLASRLRSYCARPEPDRLRALQAAAEGEAAELLTMWTGSAGAWRPDIWFTYHIYYKAPDLIGSDVARRLAIPYVIAEASHAGKRDRDAWAPFQREARRAIEAAAINFCFTARDRTGIERLELRGRIIDLPPFIRAFGTAPAPVRRPRADVRLATVAMMRPGDKLASYRLLAAALGHISDLAWRIAIAGNGPARGDVESAFSALPAGRVGWLGTLDRQAVIAMLDAADVYVWPGCGEAYGLAYLEAAARGLPSAAMDTAGVSSVVVDGRTGILVGDGDVPALAAAIRRLAAEPDLRRDLGAGAEAFATQERSLDAAAATLGSALRPLVT